MDAKKIREYLQRMGCKEIREGASFVSCRCPLAPFQHPSKTDMSPSFGVSIHADGESRWHCFVCNDGGSLTNLVWKLRGKLRAAGLDVNHLEGAGTFAKQHNHQGLEELRAKVAALEERPTSPVEIAGLTILPTLLPEPLRKAPSPLSENELHQHFEPLHGTPGEEFLRTRKGPILEADWRAWGLLWHPPLRRVAFPVRDRLGRLVGISGRDDEHCPFCATRYGKRKVEGKLRRWCWECDRAAGPKYLHSLGFRRDFYLYGEHRLQAGHAKKVYLVEGQPDAIGMWRLGYLGLGILGGYLSALQVEKTVRWFEEAVVVLDGDGAGRDMARRIYDQLAPRMRVSVALTPEGMDPDEFSPELAADLLGPPSWH